MGSRNATVVPFRPTAIDQIAMGNGAANVAALPSLKGHVIVLQAICPAGQTIYLSKGVAGVTSTAKTYPMKDGQTLTFEMENANVLAAYGDAAGAYLAYILGTYN